MMKAPPYTLTNESVTVVWEGKTHTVLTGSPNYIGLKRAIYNEDWNDLPRHLTVAKSLREWVKGKFTLSEFPERFSYNGEPVPEQLNARIIKMAALGEDPTRLFLFWERLQKNPSFRSVQQLYPFLQHEGIPLTEDGCFLAYKGVRRNYMDHHSGTVSNHPGAVNEMPRNKISDDPKLECHYGYHVGALEYAKDFASGGHVVICKVDPEHVVCVPYDHSMQKMRVCKYQVIGNWNGESLPSTSVSNRELGSAHLSSEPEVEEIEEHEEGCDCGDDCNTTAAGSLTRVADAMGFRSEDEDGGVARFEAEEEALMDEPIDVELTKKGMKATEPKAAKVEARKKATRFDKMDMVTLMKQSIEDLRRYAGHALEIVGASKIPGGKSALVKRILEVRD
jgi:hypothetical protein